MIRSGQHRFQLGEVVGGGAQGSAERAPLAVFSKQERSPHLAAEMLESIGEVEALLRVASRCRGAEEGCGRVPLGLCTGLVERPSSPLRNLPRQPTQAKGSRGVGDWDSAP